MIFQYFRVPLDWRAHCFLSLLKTMAIAVLLSGCVVQSLGPPPNLEPDDPRVIYSVPVDDMDEAQLLEQRFAIELVESQDGRIYFFAEEPVLAELRTLDYRPIRGNPFDVYERVVRIPRNVKDDVFTVYGLQMLQREDDYFVVRGSLGSIRALAETGIQIGSISAGEPVARFIRIMVTTRAELEDLGRLDFSFNDIDRVSGGYIVNGEAHDYQIDELRDRGYDVEVPGE